MLRALLTHLEAWQWHWTLLRTAIARDCYVPDSWTIRPWVFVPEGLQGALETKLAKALEVPVPEGMPRPRVTTLESVLPWKYRSPASMNRDVQDAQPTEALQGGV